ncbi:neo-calmodulin-like [Glandiceps talaboti]
MAAKECSCFTDDEVLDFKEMFAAYDRLNDGYIRVKEIGKVFKACGQNVPDGELSEIVNKFYSEGCKTINFEAFLDVMTTRYNRINPSQEEDLREAFHIFDKNGSGFVNAIEIRHILQGLRGKPEWEIDELVDDLGGGEDGRIKYEEFMQAMEYNGNNSDRQHVQGTAK